MSAREIVIRLVFSTVSTVGLSILFYIRPRRLPLATLGGFLTYAVYLLVHTVLASEFVCNMLASLAGALYAELLARRTRVPVTVYTIPCVIPLVPGSVLYRTMSSLVQSRLSDAVTYGLNTVTVALGIASGIVAGSVLAILYRSLRERLRNRRHPPLKANLNILKSVPGHRSAPVAGRRKALCRLYKSVSESLEE